MPQSPYTPLSFSTNGRGILVAATGTPGTEIHDAVSGTTRQDEVFLWAVNNDSVDRRLQIEWGGVTDPGDHIEINLTAGEGLYTVVSGLLLQNDLKIRAFAAAANVVVVYGHVRRW